MTEQEAQRDGIELLVSLPPSSAARIDGVDPYHGSGLFAASDPPGSQLGSGGGTAYLLYRAWQDRGSGASFMAWLADRPKLLIHGSGESRRLPAYAAVGKPLVPIPRIENAHGQRFDQKLLDLQSRSARGIFRYAPRSYRAMVTCGDVLVTYDRWIPPAREADVLIVGLSASAEEAERHGVLFCADDGSADVAFFLQKPAASRIHELEKKHQYYLDTGVWLLSERALRVLFGKCGWSEDDAGFAGGTAGQYELYAAMGPCLGSSPSEPDPDISGLTCSVLPLPDGRFYHFGTNRSLLASVGQLQHPARDQRSFGHATMDPPSSVVAQVSDVRCPTGPEMRHVWIDSSCLAADWRLSQRHILTGVPENDWSLDLPPGACIDFQPLTDGTVCVRCYGFDDEFRGAMNDERTSWLYGPAAGWFAARGMTFPDAAVDPEVDIQQAPLFPALPSDQLDADFVQWLIGTEPVLSAALRDKWLSSRRVSASELLQCADTVRSGRRRLGFTADHIAGMTRPAWLETCAAADLAGAARLCTAEGCLPPDGEHGADQDLAAAHDSMFRAEVSRGTDAVAAESNERNAFEILNHVIVREMEIEPVRPRRNVLEDQIVWGRSPVRIDLAGGWTDTPPYCLEHGGQVVNAAVNLNGQPPVQVFARLSTVPSVTVRSIDLGMEEQLDTYESLQDYGRLGSGFGIAKAALCLAGLDPRFHDGPGYSSLREQLEREFGGGIELTMLAAVPKGSGLGTSSILAATLLGTISELMGLGWARADLFGRTLALEQMLTSGGGWQDQVGGVLRGVKLIKTDPGARQVPISRWLPERFFVEEPTRNMMLMYYTGLTRVAHNILAEIVRGIFLNSSRHLGIVDEIGRTAALAADALQCGDWGSLCESVRRSWQLNQELDAGTNPPEVQSILAGVGDSLAASKLLGAGGGGYMLMLAKDETAAGRIRQELTASPPNDRARFVEMSLSRTGFQVTRS